MIKSLVIANRDEVASFSVIAAHCQVSEARSGGLCAQVFHGSFL